MSPNVGNFVHDLVEMAKAMETLPQVEQQLAIAKSDNEVLSQRIQDREIAIISYKDEIEALHAKVRSLEVERDDASFRVMEMEDKTNTVEQLADSAKAMLEKITSLIVPPKPVPEPEVLQPQAVELSQGQGVTDPTTVAVGQGTESGSASATVNHSENASTSIHTEAFPDQSVLPPTQEASTGQDLSETVPTPPTSPSGDQPISTEDKEPSDKYSDSWYDWCAREDRRLGYQRF